jgi:type III pantothenate kinase
VLLAVDAGNTQTHVGVFDGAELREQWRFATEPEATADELAVSVRSALDLGAIGFDAIDASIVSCVVPRLDPEYVDMSERYLGRACLMVGPGVKTGIPIRIDQPHQLGSDRIANAVAGHERADGACVVVDFGTTINFDVVSSAGEYVGGVIAPGVEISLEALTERAAKLTKVEVEAPPSVIGKTTEACIQSGTVYGFAGLVDAIARRVEDELGEDATFVATGGLAASIVPFCEAVDEIDDLLTLTGLRLIHERNS